MRRTALFAALLVLAACVTACGGGGGGDPAPTPTPGQPGTLRTIAVQGDMAPEGAGTFLAFPVATPLSAAEGSWGAFVADTSLDGRVAYVVAPNAELVPVFSEGDAAPGLATGSLGDIHQVWVNDSGLLLALVSVVGNGSGISEGLVSARVDGGVVSDVNDVVYQGATTPSGALDAFDAKFTFLTAGGEVFFRAVTSTASGFWKVAPDGSGLAQLVASGEGAPGGRTIVEVYSTGVATNGSQFTFVAETDGIQDRDGIFVGSVGSGLYGQVAVTGDPLAAGEFVGLIPYDQPLVVYGGGVPTVLYKCQSNLGEDHLILGVPDDPDYLIAREGDREGSFTGGTFGPLSWLNNAPGTTNPMFQAGLSDAQQITFGIYTLESLDFTTGRVNLALAVYNGRQVSSTSSQRFSTTFPGLAAANLVDVSSGADLTFANVMSPSGDTGLFWLVRGRGLFTTAAPGATIPGGGDSFGADTGYRSTTAENVVLFRAPLETAGSGIFRRGQ